MIDAPLLAKPGHIVLGRYTTQNSVFQFGIFDELTRIGIRRSDHRRALLKAATVTHLVIRRMMS